MKYTVLLIALLWAFVGRSQGITESCREMGLYFCANCSNTDLQCQSCSSGYTLKSDKTGCLTCPDNCTTCTTGDSTTTTNCTTCNDGYYVSNDACAVCPVDNCKNCTDGTCNDCVDNFYYNGSSCNACPNNCATCSIDTTTQITLNCVTCLSQFTLNETACVACPTNCLTCIVKSADTACVTCEDGYYIDSNKVCQKCFTDCVTCTPETNCTQCVTGKGMPADKSTCTDCATLTEITNCATCVDATSDTSAKCVSCTTGYTISDDAKECFSTPTFGTGCLEAAYKPPSCSSCMEGVGAELVSGKCYISCYTCGSLTDNVPTSTVAECNAQGNEYLNQTCEYGCSIAIKYDNNEIIFASRGCVVNATCLSDGVEQCTDTGPSQNCLKCCDSGDFCNGDYWESPPSTSASHVIGIITMSVIILAAYVMN